MKKTLLALLLAAASSMAALAQVQNHALQFTSTEGIANLGRVQQLTAPDDYTLQLWFSPATWTQGASIIRCGTFSIKLGIDHAIVVNDGTNHLTVTSGQISSGQWTQLTIRTSPGAGTHLTVNNQLTCTSSQPILLPANDKSIWLGGDFLGRIDEVRLWQGQLPTEFDSFWCNTLNEFCPSWPSLLAYWKLDQEQCPNIVDYSSDHHGTLSPSGVAKVPVTDNTAMPYLINLAYGDINRYFDRAIDAEHYRLSNRIAIIAGHYNQYTKSAHLTLEREDCRIPASASISDGKLLLSGDPITVPGTVLRLGSNDAGNPSAPTAYTFETWIERNSAQAAILMAKGDFTVKLLADGAISINDAYTSSIRVPLSQLTHIGVSVSGTNILVKVGDNSQTLSLPTAFAPGINDSDIIVGRDFTGTLDDIMFIAKARSLAEMQSDAKHIPVGDDKFRVSAPGQLTHLLHGCYSFDDQKCPGYDSFSVHNCYAKMRSHTQGMRGVKYLLSLAANNFAQGLADANVRASLGKTMADMGNDPMYDGLDLDFEWPQNANEWNNVALLCQVIRQNLNPDKELTVSPHAKYYVYPTARMSDIDFFNFQIYGPNDIGLFTQSRFPGYANNFINHGYPKDQIVMSYATTTNGGSNEAGTRVASSHPGYYPNGYVSLGDVPKDATKVYHAGNDCWYYLTAYNQTYWRAHYCVENGLRGIMYWDMGNDVPASNPLSLAIAASLGLNSNVETLVTSVDTAAPAPADDSFAPTATDDPDDQGGFDPAAAAEAIKDALLVYARRPGYATACSAQRQALLTAINQAKLGAIDADALNAVVQAYLSDTSAEISGPVDGKKYYVVGVNSNDQTQRALYFDGSSLKIDNTTPNAAKYEWTATVAADGSFTLSQGDSQLLGQSFQVVPGNSLGRLQFVTSDGKYLNSRYVNQDDPSSYVVDPTTDANQDASNPKKWSSQWQLREVAPELPALYTVSVEGIEGGVAVGTGANAVHGEQIYHEPEASVSASPTGYTLSSIDVDHDAQNIAVTYGGLHSSKLYRLANCRLDGDEYLAVGNDGGMHISELNPMSASQIFSVKPIGNGKFVLTMQGTNVGATSDDKAAQITASATPGQFHVVHRTDGTVAFDAALSGGGTWVNGSRALSVPTSDGTQNYVVKTWATGTIYSWWTPQEVTSLSVPTVTDGTDTFAAVCLPFAFTTAGQTFSASIEEDGRLSLQSVDQPIASGTPVIIINGSDVTVSSEPAVPAASQLKGTMLPSATAGLTLGLDSNGKPAFIPSQSIPANSAWIEGNDPLPIAAPEFVSVSLPVSTNQTEAYDLQGRRVANPSRGLYIINGHKTLLR